MKCKVRRLSFGSSQSQCQSCQPKHSSQQSQFWWMLQAQIAASSASSSPESPLLGRVPRGSCCYSFLHFCVSLLQPQQLKADGRVQWCNRWSYGWKRNAASAAGTKAFNTIRDLLEAVGCSPGSSHPPLSPDWAWCGDVMLCSPAQPLAACHRDLLSLSRFCLDPLPFLLPHISKCTCSKINGSLKTKSNVCFGMLLIHLFGSSYCSSGLPWSSLSAHPAALICSLNFCCGYISIPVNSQGCCLNAINPLSQREFLY